MKLPALATALIASLALAGCSRGDLDSEIASLADQVVEEVRADLADDDFTLRAEDGSTWAKVTPQGALLIDGVALDLDEDQRAAVLAYRAEYLRVAAAGAAMGVQVAGVVEESIRVAFAGVLAGGDEAGIEKAVLASTATARLKAEARTLCDSLPQLKTAQDALAARVPEFAPYARLDDSDFDDCVIDI